MTCLQNNVVTFTLMLNVMQATLVELKGRGKSVTCDWVGRSIYWLEESNNRRQMNAIMKYDLHSNTDTSTTVLLRPTSVTFGSLLVYPSHR